MKYSVEYHLVQTGWIEVEAENEERAKTLARRADPQALAANLEFKDQPDVWLGRVVVK